MDNRDYGFNYIKLNPVKLKLYIFIDNLFINNKDINS